MTSSGRETLCGGRIPGPQGFDHCLKKPAVWRRGVFAFHVVFVESPAWRLGLVVPKRFEKSAVARNTIKRRWREAFRRQRAAWAVEFGGADLVIRMQAPLVPRTPPSRRVSGVAKKGTPVQAPPAVPTVVTTARGRGVFDATGLLAGLGERLRQRTGRL